MKQNEKHQITPQIAITIADDWIEVDSVYTPTASIDFHSVGGRFDNTSKLWRLPRTSEAYRLLERQFGIDFIGENPTIRVQLDSRYLLITQGFEGQNQAAMLRGYILAYRHKQNMPVKMGKGVKKIRGGFSSYLPGSALNPDPSTVVEIEVTQLFAKRLCLDKPLDQRGFIGSSSSKQERHEKRASMIQGLSDQELLAEFERRGLAQPTKPSTPAPKFDDTPKPCSEIFEGVVREGTFMGFQNDQTTTGVVVDDFPL